MIKVLKTKNVFLLLLIAVLFLFISISFVSASCDSSESQCTSSFCDYGDWLSGKPFSTGTDASCCGEPGELAAIEIWRRCTTGAVPYGCTLDFNDNGCSSSGADYCIYNGVLYLSVVGGDTHRAYNNPAGTSQTSDRKITCVYTQGGSWIDCDYSSLYCGSDCGTWTTAGEITGEYSSVGASGCCGDDGNEYSVNKDCDGNTVTAKCCSSSTDVLDSSGNCILQSACPSSCSGWEEGCESTSDCCSFYQCATGPGWCVGICGDGEKVEDEECDDGNTANNDGCSSTCKIEDCGDGIQQTNEECDEGAANVDSCAYGEYTTLKCATTTSCGGWICEWCGDGTKNGPEDCDGTDGVPEGYTCNSNCGLVSETCTPDCTGLECGPDPICETSCGTCTSPEICSSGTCVSDTEGNAGTCEGPCSPLGGYGSDAGCQDGLWCQNYDGSALCRTAGGSCTQDCDCVQGQICESGTCVCSDTRTDSEVCGTQECDYKNDNCGLARPCGTCTSPEFCSSGICTTSCVDECSSGDTRCSGNDAQNCVLNSESGCYEWNTIETCISPEICSNGVCVSSEDCGNGIVDIGETCDGSDLSGKSCTDFDLFTGGTLSCDGNCDLDTSSCAGGTTGTCGDGVVNIGETCDGSDLSGKSCTDFDLFTGGYITCDSSCKIDTSNCNFLDPCELTSATWGLTEVTEGEQVQLIVNGNNCDGFTISFEVWEDDLIGDDLANIQPNNVVMNSGSAVGAWTAEWVSDTSGDPEYYFIASTNPSITSADPKLIVTQDTNYCQDIPVELCSDYTSLGQSKCELDYCGVIGNSIPEGIDCDADGVDCACTWRVETGECAASYSSGNIGTCYLQETGESDNCDDGFLTYSWTALWEWNSGNYIYEDPLSTDYVEDPTGEWHYDPINLFTGLRKNEQCVAGSNTIACPAQIQLPFFNTYNLIVTLIVIILIYILINSASKKKKLIKRKRKRK